MDTRTRTGPKGGRPDQTTYADDMDTLEKLKHYLCREAIKPRVGVNVEICRSCESQCGFGRKYVRMWDAGERPAPKIRKPKEDKPVPTVRKSADEMTMQEQLEAKVQENMQLHDVNRKLLADLRAIEEQLSGVEDCLAEERKKRKGLQLQLYKLKAKLYDVEHPEEDDG